MERGAWTDERLEDRFDQIDRRLDRLDADVRDLRAEIVDLRSLMIRLHATTLIAFLGVFAAILARGG
jgi:hypothetical protein